MLSKNKTLLPIYTQFYDFVSLGFDEKKSLDHIAELHPKYRSTINRILAKLRAGYSIFDAFESESSQKALFNLTCSSINSSTWIHFKIIDLKQHQHIFNTYMKPCLYPLLFFMSSCLLNLVFIFVFLPQTQHMLSQFNVTPPVWVQYLNHFRHFFSHYGLSVFVGFGLLAMLLQRFSKPLLHRLGTKLLRDKEYKSLLELMVSLTEAGLDLKSTVSAINCHKNAYLYQSFQTFKHGILVQHSFQKAFKSLLSQSCYHEIIIQSIESSQLNVGLRQVISLLNATIERKFSSICTGIKLTATTLTTIQIAIGFYMSMYPMNQLLRRVMI